MTCERCHDGELKPTQVSRMSEGLGKIGYGVGIGAVLMVGASIGLGLALVRQGGLDLAPVLVAVAVVVLACAPLFLITALRMFREK